MTETVGKERNLLVADRSVAAAKGRGGQSATKRLVPYAYLSPTIILLFVLSLLPIGMVFYYSLMNNVVMEKNPYFVGLANYLKILQDKVFQEAVRNTLVFTGLSVVFHLVLGLSFAMLLNTKIISPLTRAIFRVVYILPWVFTAAIIAVLWRLMLNPNGIINYMLITIGLIERPVEWLSSRQLALPSVTFINIWSGYPFYMVSLLAGLQGIPDELYEAGKIDGGNNVQLFRHITIPQLMPIIVSLAMLDFIWTVQQFTLIWMTTGGGPIHVTEMLSTFTYKLAFSTYKFSLASASAFIILIITMFVAVFYVRKQRASDA